MAGACDANENARCIPNIVILIKSIILKVFSKCQVNESCYLLRSAVTTRLTTFARRLLLCALPFVRWQTGELNQIGVLKVGQRKKSKFRERTEHQIARIRISSHWLTRQSRDSSNMHLRHAKDHRRSTSLNGTCFNNLFLHAHKNAGAASLLSKFGRDVCVSLLLHFSSYFVYCCLDIKQF